MTSKETGHCELALILPLEVINQYLKNDVIELFKKDIESIEKSLRFIKNVFFYTQIIFIKHAQLLATNCKVLWISLSEGLLVDIKSTNYRYYSHGYDSLKWQS